MSEAGGRWLRSADEEARVTNVELFFDLVYVFAVTQLSHLLVSHATADGAVQTLLLLAIVWQVWVYTTWVTNWLDPDRLPVRAMLLAVMLASLVLSAELPRAFENRGLIIAGAYALIQVGRSIFTIVALRGHRLQRNFERILAWCTVSGAALILGAFTHGHVRELIWAAAIAFDVLGGRAGFWTPGLGRSKTEEWTIEGSHFAERCEGFVIIALGESIVAIGSTLSGLVHLTPAVITTFVVAFAGTAGLWWVYFDRIAERGSQAIATSDDPGRLGATAYHLVHPIIVAGIIAAAAADDLVLHEPLRHGHLRTSLLVVGGAALFLGGHAIFKALIFRVVPVARLVAVAVLGLLLLVAPHINALSLGIAVLVVILAVAATDRSQHRSAAEAAADAEREGDPEREGEGEGAKEAPR
jgi:low temperature requirement protein LtrA